MPETDSMLIRLEKITIWIKMFIMLKIHSLNCHLALEILNRYSEIKDDFTNYLEKKSYSLCFVLFDVW